MRRVLMCVAPSYRDILAAISVPTTLEEDTCQPPRRSLFTLSDWSAREIYYRSPARDLPSSHRGCPGLDRPPGPERHRRGPEDCVGNRLTRVGNRSHPLHPGWRRLSLVASLYWTGFACHSTGMDISFLRCGPCTPRCSLCRGAEPAHVRMAMA